jgi:hypothetical protein
MTKTKIEFGAELVQVLVNKGSDRIDAIDTVTHAVKLSDGEAAEMVRTLNHKSKPK